MRKISAISTTAAATLVGLTLLSGCGSDSADARPEDAADAAGGLDRCALLTDEEVEQAIGAHDGGKRELGNTWGLGSCRWKAAAVQKSEAFPDGWSDTIEVAVFDEEFVKQWARGEAEGEPVAGFAEGTLYDHMSGELWFNCPGDRFCVVDVGTASGDKREEIAKRFARLVEGRLRTA